MPYIFMEWKELVISARRSFDDDASKVFFLNLRSSPGWKKFYVFVILNSKDKSQVSKPRWLHWPDESTRLLSKVIEEESMGSSWSFSIPDGRRSWLWCRSIAWKDPLLMCFGFTSPPGPVSPDICNDSILCNFGNIRMKYDDDFHFFRRPIWDEAKDWVLECAFHSQLRFIGGYFRLEVWNLLKASQCIILHVYQHLGNTSTPQRMLHALPSYLSESFYIFIHS